jgi:hypothetical protein
MGKDVADPLAEVAGRILVVRGQRVILDADLARLYDVSTKAFNQAVRRILPASLETSCSSLLIRKLRVQGHNL